jgi:ABC-type branched-subunit amino acid transport system ATPase component
MELFESMTVAANVALGSEAKLAGRSLPAHVFATRRDRTLTTASVTDALTLCHLQDLADTHVAALSGGQRRLVELARCLAGHYRILLLDEPSTGLDRTERQHFVEVLKQTVRQRGVGVLIVEHDMELVMNICDEIYALTFGKLIAHGTPEEIQADRAVAEAYFGTGYATPT